MRQILRDPSLARRKREGYINAMRNLGCDTAVMTTVAMGAAGGAFGGLGHGLAITANTWTFGLISPLDSHAEGLQDAYGHLAEYRMAAGAAEFGREAAIAALTGGAGNVALKAGRFAAAARGVYAAGQVYNGVQVGQGLYAAYGAFSQGNVLQGVLLAVTSGVGPGPAARASTSWTTARREYWKQRAKTASPDDFTADNLRRMSEGKPPLHDEYGVPMELHHIKPRREGGSNDPSNLLEVWPWEHEQIDKHRRYRGPRPPGF